MLSRVLVRVNTTVGAASAPAAYLRSDIGSLSDEALLRCCACGETAALEELVRRHQSPLFRFLCRLMDSTEDAEEAVLEVFLRAWNHAPRFQFRARVSTYLYRIALNMAHDTRARRNARPRTIRLDAFEISPTAAIGDAEEIALNRLENEERSRALERALRGLGARDRSLLVLYYLEDRSYEEIQEITSLPYTVLKMRLSRARQRLRRLLEDQNNEAAL